MIDHAEVLNLMLANACPFSDPEENNAIGIYHFEVHCAEFYITAKYDRFDTTTGKYYYDVIGIHNECPPLGIAGSEADLAIWYLRKAPTNS